jgi:GT2 family glycosyltransferase
MSDDVTVIVPVFGDHQRWAGLARRAALSAIAQTTPPARVFVSLAEDLCMARNGPAEWARTEWLCFLDADDELDVHYLEAMLAADGDLRQPATLGVVDGREDAAPVVIPARPLLDANYIVIGAFIRTELFWEVGGFRDLPAYEDWDLWIRAWLAGAAISCVPDAIYRVHVSPTGRNALTRPEAISVYHQVRSCYVGQSPRIRQ